MPPNSSDEFEVDEQKMFALCMRYDYFVTCLSAAKHSEIIVASFASYFEFPAAVCIALFPHSAREANSVGAARLGGSDFLLFFIAKQTAHSLR